MPNFDWQVWLVNTSGQRHHMGLSEQGKNYPQQVTVERSHTWEHISATRRCELHHEVGLADWWAWWQASSTPRNYNQDTISENKEGMCLSLRNLKPDPLLIPYRACWRLWESKGILSYLDKRWTEICKLALSFLCVGLPTWKLHGDVIPAFIDAFLFSMMS